MKNEKIYHGVARREEEFHGVVVRNLRVIFGLVRELKNKFFKIISYENI